MLKPPGGLMQSTDGQEHCSASLLAEIHDLAGAGGFYLGQEPQKGEKGNRDIHLLQR